MIDLESLEVNKEDEIEDTSVLDLGIFSNEKMEDSIISSWNQLFNELVDEGEERIDRKFGEVRRKEDVTNSAKSIIQDYVQKIKENLGSNISKVEHYLYGFLRKNYSMTDENDIEEHSEQDVSFATNSYSDILKRIDAWNGNDGFDVIIAGGNFLRASREYDSSNYKYTYYVKVSGIGGRTPDGDLNDAKKWLKQGLDTLKKKGVLSE